GGFAGAVYDYRMAAALYQRRVRPAHTFYRCVAPGWDNTPRVGRRALVLKGSTPQAFFDWLSWAIDDTIRHNAPEHRIIFINAWNEWGEGAFLEPSERWGRQYLEAARDALAAYEPEGALTGRLRAQAAELAAVRTELEDLRRTLGRLDLR